MNRHFFLSFVAAASALVGTVHGVDQLPWFEDTLEIQWRTGYYYQHYNYVNADGHDVYWRGRDHIVSTSLAIAPFPHWSAELEVAGGRTSDWDVSLHRLVAQLRYRWMDDVVGEPLSVVSGLQIRAPFKAAQRSLSTPDHSYMEFEGHLAVGKEMAKWERWYARTWFVVASGVGVTGKCWVRAEGSVEGQSGGGHMLRLFSRSQLGMGDETLDLSESFRDYGDIRYRFVDVGARYTVPFDYIGSLDIEYCYRVWAREFPVRAHLVQVAWVYPFGF